MSYNDAYQIEFVNGKEYTQTFYFGNHFIYSENNKAGTGVISFLLVIDYLSQSKIMKLVFTRFALRLI